MNERRYQVIVIGGGHAGVEAAWAAANLLGESALRADSGPPVALVTLDPAKIGVMSCNPAIGGLAKGQIVREIDAMGGLMGLAADAAGIQFKVLNASKGVAVQGPRAQCDKHAYARAVQRMIASRPEIEVIAGSVEEILVEGGGVVGVRLALKVGTDGTHGTHATHDGVALTLRSGAVVLTTGTFMRGLMHTGEAKSEGGRFGEAAAVGISGALKALGFELGRLKTGTPPRLKRSTIDWDALPKAMGDETPAAFSDLSSAAHPLDGQTGRLSHCLQLEERTGRLSHWFPSVARFPVMPQVPCAITTTNQRLHDLIRANIHRAPMYSGQIESVGPRYCPSIEDKVVRFADKQSHQVFLEPESLEDDWVYCNGISTSLPKDVQDEIVRSMPGCERAEIYRYGYAVEYDMVPPHQIHASGMTKLVRGLFLAGQINGTSGYEEAAGQGLIAGINAARLARDQDPITLGRDQAYIGVMMDDLVTKTPREPYRMFTSRAEHRLLLRSDNAADRLTPLASQIGLLDSTALGRARKRLFETRTAAATRLHEFINTARARPSSASGATATAFIRDLIRRPDFSEADLADALRAAEEPVPEPAVLRTVLADRQYAAYIERQKAEIKRQSGMERRRIAPRVFTERALAHLRTEARQALLHFRPETFGQAGRLEGLTPADLTLLAVLVRKSADDLLLDASP